MESETMSGITTFKDDAVKAAKRIAFDNPTIANLDALIEAVRADQRRADDARWSERMTEQADTFKEFTDDRSFAAHRVGLLFAHKELTAAIRAAALSSQSAQQVEERDLMPASNKNQCPKCRLPLVLPPIFCDPPLPQCKCTTQRPSRKKEQP